MRDEIEIKVNDKQIEEDKSAKLDEARSSSSTSEDGKIRILDYYPVSGRRHANCHVN